MDFGNPSETWRIAIRVVALFLGMSWLLGSVWFYQSDRSLMFNGFKAWAGLALVLSSALSYFPSRVRTAIGFIAFLAVINGLGLISWADQFPTLEIFDYSDVRWGRNPTVEDYFIGTFVYLALFLPIAALLSFFPLSSIRERWKLTNR